MLVYAAKHELSARADFVAVAKTLKKKKKEEEEQVVQQYNKFHAISQLHQNTYAKSTTKCVGDRPTKCSCRL